MKKSRKIAVLSAFTALALIIGFVESLLPPIFPALPFVKIGLANAVVLFILIKFSLCGALTVSLIKGVLVPIFAGNPFMIAYSLPSGIISVLVSFLLLKIHKNSIPFISVASAAVHNFTQLLVAYFVMGTASVFAYTSYLTFISFLCGLPIGILVFYVIKIKHFDALL